MKIKFLGATQQMTGSSYLLEAGGLRIIIDCGLYQEREYRSRNWDPFPVPAKQIDCVILTHVHLDHSGLVPKLVREGFSGRILTTSASNEMLEIVLMQEKTT
jgi:metallo-beta-lactamase family protein